MKTLPVHYRLAKHNSDYDMIERNACAAIYSQSVNGVIRGYEVIRIRFQKTVNTGRFTTEAGECLPSDAQWGKFGWTCQRLERAKEKFAELSTSERMAKAEEQRAKIGLTTEV